MGELHLQGKEMTRALDHALNLYEISELQSEISYILLCQCPPETIRGSSAELSILQALGQPHLEMPSEASVSDGIFVAQIVLQFTIMKYHHQAVNAAAKVGACRSIKVSVPRRRSSCKVESGKYKSVCPSATLLLQSGKRKV